MAVVLWWNVWSAHPTATTTCSCGDSALFLWFFAWPAHALAHGLDPFASAAMSHPGGVNLLANTSVLALGVVLAPVTWVFGPVASMNVALTVAPALSALAMFVLVRRWVDWTPAAFGAGLLYGFSPLVLVGLSDAHLMLGWAVVPPLVVVCLDELLTSSRHGPVVIGVVLGLLLVVQFFVGTEVLLLLGIAGVCAGPARAYQVGQASRTAAVAAATARPTTVRRAPPPGGPAPRRRPWASRPCATRRTAAHAPAMPRRSRTSVPTKNSTTRSRPSTTPITTGLWREEVSSSSRHTTTSGGTTAQPSIRWASDRPTSTSGEKP